MARTCRIAYNNLVRITGGVITASGSDYGYPVTNLVSPERWQKWKSTSAAAKWVKIDLGSNQSLQAILLADVTVEPGQSVFVQANATDAWGSPTVNVDLTSQVGAGMTGVIGTFLGAAVNLRWLRVYWPNAGTVNAAASLGVWFAGAYFQPVYSLAPGYGLRPVDTSEVVRSPGGQRSASRGNIYHEINGRFEATPDADRPAMITMIQAVGRHTPFYFAIDPDQPGYFVYYGRFDEIPNFGHLAAGSHWQIPFRFSEDVGARTTA